MFNVWGRKRLIFPFSAESPCWGREIAGTMLQHLTLALAIILAVGLCEAGALDTSDPEYIFTGSAEVELSEDGQSTIWTYTVGPGTSNYAISKVCALLQRRSSKFARNGFSGLGCGLIIRSVDNVGVYLRRSLWTCAKTMSSTARYSFRLLIPNVSFELTFSIVLFSSLLSPSSLN